MRVPRPLSSFVGRVGTLADLGLMLRERQLITLTGPGGSGKTRLAIELAERVSDDFGDGAVFVPQLVIDGVEAPELVPFRPGRTV